MAEDVIISIASMIWEGLLKPIGHQFHYLFQFNKNVQELRKQLGKLESVKYKVQLSIDAAHRKGEHIKLEAEKWLTDVEIVTEDAGKLEDDVKKRCFNGWCLDWLDWCSCCRLRKEISQKSIIIADLQEEGNFDEVSYPGPSRGIESLHSRDFQTFESTKSALNQIIELLKCDESRILCVCGMGGIGKTTLVREVGKKAKEEKLFDEVVTAIVSQAPDLIKIQGELADALGMELKRKTVTGRASQLSERLKMEKKILIILDDVWEVLDLAAIGIPHGIDHKGCKILLTTRLQHLCNVMGSQATKILLNILNEQESWALFRSNAGAIVDSPAYNTVAMEVAKKCQGLPLALVTVGRALSDKDLDGWKEAAKQLRDYKPMNIQDMDANIFSCLKLSFDYLQGEEITLIFLLCCLFPEDCDIEMEYLTRLVVGQGWFNDVDTAEEARRRVRTLIKSLKSSSLLMESDKLQGCVKIHDLVRGFAISITCGEQYGYMVQSGVGLKNWPKKDNFEHYAVVSLMANNICSLPVGLECPKLRTLLLGRNHGLNIFPDAFFEGMKALKVLDVSAICEIFYSQLHVTPLPESIQLLADLRMLHLHHRKLGDISILGKLKKLEILSLFASYIKELPKEIGELKSLRLLDLTYCRSLKKIPPNLISGLSGLEELYMRGSFQQWEVCGTTKERSNVSLAELKSLPFLTILHVEIINSKSLPKDFLLPSLSRFQIYIGSKLSFTVFTRKLQYDYPTSRTLELKGITIPIPVGVKELFERTEDLCLINLKEGSHNIFPHLGSGGFNGLVSLSVKHCYELDCITNTVQRVRLVVFPNLEALHLTQLSCLRMVCIGTLPRGSFKKLRALTVEHCDRLSTLFPGELLQMLQNLERLRISWCQEMQVVFQIEGILIGEEHVLPLSSLRALKLNALPRLGYVWKSSNPQLSLHNLEVFEIEGCNSLRHLFQPSMAQSLSKLEYFKILDCLELEQIVAQEDDEAELDLSNFQNKKPFLALPKLKVLEVKGCKKLKSLFSVSTARSLLQLKELKICGNEELKEIASCEDEEISVVDKIVLPQLNKLKLQSLPVLENFCGENFSFQWPSLEKVVLKKCPKMTTFSVAASNGVSHTPKLKTIRVDGKTIDNNRDLNKAINHLFKGEGMESDIKANPSEIVEDS